MGYRFRLPLVLFFYFNFGENLQETITVEITVARIIDLNYSISINIYEPRFLHAEIMLTANRDKIGSRLPKSRNDEGHLTEDHLTNGYANI